MTGQYFRLLEKGMISVEDEEPELGGLSFYLECFRELSSCRTSGMGIAPIPFTAIAQYFNIYELEEFEEFLYIIRKMDNAFMESEEIRMKAKENKNASSNTGKRHKNKS